MIYHMLKSYKKENTKNKSRCGIDNNDNNNKIQHNGSASPSLFSTMKEGFAFGLGSSAARGVFDSLIGNQKVISHPEEVASGNVYLPDKKKYNSEELFNMYIECINNANGNMNEINACSKILE